MKRNTIIKEINQLNLMLYRALIARYKKLNIEITPVQSRIIMFIYNSDIKIHQKDIERFLSCNKSTLSSILSNMEDKNLIRKVGFKEDLRSKIIELTPLSKSVASSLSCDRDKIDKLLSTGLTSSEIDNFFKILHKIESNIERI